MATQIRLMSAKILVINLGGIGSEVVKNLVLGGIHSLEIWDPSAVKDVDFESQFFLPNSDEIIGKKKLPLVLERIKELNSRVNLSVNMTPNMEILSNSEISSSYLSRFDLIIGTELTKEEMLSLNEYTRKLNIALYVAGMHGMFGYVMTDLIEHISVAERDVGNQRRIANTKINRCKTIVDVKYDKEESKEEVTILDKYVPISQVLKSRELRNQLNKRQMRRLAPTLPLIFSLFDFIRPTHPEDTIDIEKLKEKLIEICAILDIPQTVISEEYLELFTKQAFTEFAPVAAILGGCIAQDVIQFLSKKESPINNCLIFDALRSEMPIYSL